MNLEELRCNAYYDLAEQMGKREKELGISTAEEYRQRMKNVDSTYDDNISAKDLQDCKDCELSLNMMITIAEALECKLKIELIPND